MNKEILNHGVTKLGTHYLNHDAVLACLLERVGGELAEQYHVVITHFAKTVDEFLYANENMKMNAAFRERFFLYLQTQYPWLEKETFNTSVIAHSNWLGRREGLFL